jgi:hypothetical protein
MAYAPRTIAFLCELLHPPLVPDSGPIQRVHNRMFQSGSPLYRSFTVAGTGAVLSNPTSRPGAVSSAGFLADRYQFREELTGLTPEDFTSRVREVTEMAVAERPVQLFTAQVVTIRTLINPRRFQDSRAYLKDGVFGFGEELGELGREPQLYGMRLVFPPSQEEPWAFTLRVESFANDPRSLFLENQGSFGPLVGAAGYETLERNIAATYDFLVQRALPFLAHFDVRQEA